MRWTFCVFALTAILGLVGCGPKPVVTPPAPGPSVGPVSPTPSPMPSPTPPAVNPDPAAPLPAPVPDPGVPAPAPEPGQPAPGTGATLNPTNTGVNVRDRDADAKTPLDQANDDLSTKITATIRKRITDTEGMSINARNAKIITEANRITLRGPVASSDEKTKIEMFAKEAAPVNFQVINMLEVP